MKKLPQNKTPASKDQLMNEISLAVQLFQEATDAFDFAAAERLGLNQTDLKCLGIIMRKSPVSASEVAKGSGLTRGAATTALDRIEKAGFAKRIPDPNDRRGILLEKTLKATKAIEKIWGPFRKSGEEIMSQFTASELQAILQFLKDGTDMQINHLKSLSVE